MKASFDTFKNKLGFLTQGHHACLFYKDKAVSRQVTKEYIKIGLQNNERCLYLADPPMILSLKNELKKEIDVDYETGRGALMITSDRSHLIDDHFDSRRMIMLLKEGIDDALKAGFAGLRATGDVVWELGNDLDLRKLENYEIALDHFFFGKKLTGLCQYNCEVVQEDYLCRSFSSHNAIVLDGLVSLKNPFHGSALSGLKLVFKQMVPALR